MDLQRNQALDKHTVHLYSIPQKLARGQDYNWNESASRKQLKGQERIEMFSVLWLAAGDGRNATGKQGQKAAGGNL